MILQNLYCVTNFVFISCCYSSLKGLPSIVLSNFISPIKNPTLQISPFSTFICPKQLLCTCRYRRRRRIDETLQRISDLIELFFRFSDLSSHSFYEFLFYKKILFNFFCLLLRLAEDSDLFNKTFPCFRSIYSNRPTIIENNRHSVFK